MRFASLALLLSACGGGGSDSSSPNPLPPSPEPSFGLTIRPPLAEFSLPGSSVGLGSYSLVVAFPNLNFSNALYLAGVPSENRLVVVRQSGQVHAFVDSDSSVSDATLVLDLSSRVLFSGEQGLLGLAFDPDFTNNRFIYLHYSMNGPRRSVISRFTWVLSTDSVDQASEKIIMQISQPFSNHNGGMLAFGPDNYLYIGMGDGGSGGDPDNNAQNPQNPLGSMLRIDVHPQNPNDAYDIPADNPFLNEAGVMPETYAYGLRNPFRFSFDRQTGELWLGDVGQGNLEEIDIIHAGNNYGWRVFEGSDSFDGSANSLPASAFTPPVFEYDHSNGGVAIIGGYRYRGNALAGLQGKYLYSDFGSGAVWALEWDGSTVLGNVEIAQASLPTSFGEDNQGEVYVVSRTGSILAFEESSGGGNLPGLLSETGIFTDLAQLRPASGLIEYAINHPFWSDGVYKRRWLALPDNEQIQFSATGAWEFPVGAFTIKHFEIELIEGDPSSRRRLETRVMVNTQSGWQGFTYRWNAGQSDAILLSARETESIDITLADNSIRTQLYEYPARTDCLRCHTQAGGFVLGPRTRQMNKQFDYISMADNQLRSLNNIGMFTSNIGDGDAYETFSPIDDTATSIAIRARTYLDVNCAVCHQPGGTTPVDLDLRFDTPDTLLNAIGVAPLVGNLGVADAEIIAAGERQRSILWLRMQSLSTDRMPPLSSHVVDSEGLSLIGEWIDLM